MAILGEIQEKERRVREFLKARNLEALLLKRQANFSWMTGGGLNVVGTATELGNASLLITENGKYVITNNIEAPRMVEEERLEEQGYQIRTFPWHEDREPSLVREIAGSGPVGCDWPFPDAAIVAEDVAKLRYSLTPEELVRYRWLGARVSAALEQTMIAAEKGEKESAVVGRLCLELWKDRIDTMGMMSGSDERISRFRHCIPTEKRVEKLLMVSVNARKGGLIVCLTRFVHFGKVPKDLRERYEANVFIDCVFMTESRPGVPAREVLRKGIEAYAAKGYPEEWKLHHQGGSIGYNPRDYRVTPGTPDIIQENQPFAWNPSLTGTKSEDTILATSREVQLITKPVFYPALSCEAAGSTFVRPNILEKD
jgi:Xaa-Pro dipeptidase